MKKIISFLICIIICISSPFNSLTAEAHTSSSSLSSHKFKYEYGVFLSIGEEQTNRLKDYHIVVIDAEYFSKKSITKLKKDGHIVYTYLNIGSIENFRKDYNKYKKYCIGDYENWSEEKWVDVSQKPWQERIKNIAQKYNNKGVDGFFIDNCDVYYFMGLELDGTDSQKVSSNRLFQGLCTILKDLRTRYDKPVIINGGDTFVNQCIKKKYNLKKYFTAVNQECVYTMIDFDNNKLKKANADDTRYYESYLKRVNDKGIRIFLLEYTRSKSLTKSIKHKCDKKGYTCYVSRSIELN